ncbi:EamA family transporter [Sphingobium nicotianae]|uniref:EamA family transporter n=1 Tax=Sphingobium nicotianae TaxID=2782607 RepID=A0A9X1DDI8_9SPHN|nr:EamA family transporter [Sphingobium nicotianae]MBT2187926.1 EamA family transporter [Sphingobium nicotianae]
MTLALFALIVASVTLNAFAQIILRKAMLVAAPLPPLSEPFALGLHLLGNAWLWAGFICFGGSILLWLGVLSRVPVSIAYPMASLGYVVAMGVAILFLGETVTLARVVGLVLICAGVYFVANSA